MPTQISSPFFSSLGRDLARPNRRAWFRTQGTSCLVQKHSETLRNSDQMGNGRQAQKVVLYARKGARLDLIRRPHLKPRSTRDTYFTI